MFLVSWDLGVRFGYITHHSWLKNSVLVNSLWRIHSAVKKDRVPAEYHFSARRDHGFGWFITKRYSNNRLSSMWFILWAFFLCKISLIAELHQAQCWKAIRELSEIFRSKSYHGHHRDLLPSRRGRSSRSCTVARMTHSSSPRNKRPYHEATRHSQRIYFHTTIWSVS